MTGLRTFQAKWAAYTATVDKMIGVCPDRQTRIDVTHCYTAEEFGEANGAVCESWPQNWATVNPWDFMCEMGRYMYAVRNAQPCSVRYQHNGYLVWQAWICLELEFDFEQVWP